MRTEQILNFLFNLQKRLYLCKKKMDKNTLKKIIIEWQEFISKVNVIERNISYDKNMNYVFVGSRRVGKTYFMYQIISDLIKSSIPIQQILFINFEDERLLEFNSNDLDLIIETYKSMYDFEPIYFFDEIQNISGWEKFVRRLADKNNKIYVTGSNAKLLSSEIASTLGGRFNIKEIAPLNFMEFLKFKKVKLEPNFEFSEQRFEIKRYFEEFFYFGAFPETLRFENKKEYLSNLYLKVFYGDIITRNKISNDYALKLLVKKIAESTTNETSFNRMANLIKSIGVKVGTATLIDYFKYLEDAFLIYDLKNFTSKFSQKETIKKFYFIDTGILNLFISNPQAQLLETVVFNVLRQKYKKDEIFFYKDNFEIDFYIPNKEIIQVSYTINEQNTKEREINSILKNIDNLSFETCKIITYDDTEETIEKNKVKIEIVPIWKWCLL